MQRNEEDKQLVKRAQEGEKEAFVTLYEVYLPAIFGYLYSQTGTKQDAEDLAQDTLTEAFRGIGKFKGEASFKNWLYQISKYKLADWLREKYKKPTISLEDFCPAANNPSPFFDEDNEVEDRKTQSKLNDILEKLPQHYREVLEYRFLKNYTLKETAAELGKTEGNIKVLQYRALKKASLLIQ